MAQYLASAFAQHPLSTASIPATLLLVFALGLRHGADPDHLTAIDGLSRIRPSRAIGVLFALGHGLLVTLLAAGIGRLLSNRLTFLQPWLLVSIGVMNLWRLRPRASNRSASARPLVAQPFLLGIILAAGFETGSQLSVIILGGYLNVILLGAVFTLGMVLTDGLDGWLAAATQRLAAQGGVDAQAASRFLGVLVVVYAFSLAAAEWMGFDFDRWALPLGVALFACTIGPRVWMRARAYRHARAALAES